MEMKVAKNTSNCSSIYVNLLSNYAPIKQLLQQQILAAMGLSGRGIAAADLSGTAELTVQMIPVHRVSDDSGVVYRSAIALKLAPLWQLSALDIAHQLMASFPTINQDDSEQMSLDFNIEVVSPGWINFRLSDRTLAAWLQHLIQIPPLLSNPMPCSLSGQKGKRERKINNEYSSGLDLSDKEQVHTTPKDVRNLFPVQYVHARCCSLLRLAHQQGLIKLRDFDLKTHTCTWQIVEPNPIPWLNDDQGVATEQMPLRLVHPAERGLIAQLLDLQDEVGYPDQVNCANCVKRASALSNAFERFYSSCRIWGEVTAETPKLAQARLGLVGVTGGSLKSLLQDQLAVPAPIAL
jgi:arginyl-tRNA synthetase